MSPFVRAQLDYYAMLEIDHSADVAEINAAFRRLAWRYHPDRNPAPGSTLQFQDINEAHQVLSDPVRRAVYDAEWPAAANAHRGTSHRSVRSHKHRSTRRRRRFRAGVLAVVAFMFVSTAWALIFTAMSSAHYAVANDGFAGSSSFSREASQGCGFTMEMFPVTYKDELGRQSTAWETNVRNCWGGSTQLSSVPNLRPQPAGRFVHYASYR
jgi:curved DNA-binding protein CbpA